ncbi:hypothetical protein P7K49_030679 [Saguinus oedipus]|uniref:Uncharacterized protein n=1 Tax=Saguinus oedipus TaxID=9490 RepID=A0ABQ9U3P2_SAGOE|nr:hypothetical protein P7K49_030679 [Saguinus oedipus]
MPGSATSGRPGQDTKLGASKTHRCTVQQEDATGQFFSDIIQQVDDGYVVPACQLLQVPQDSHLEADEYQAVQDPGVQEEGQPQAVELVRDLEVEEKQEPTHIIHAVHLRAECRLVKGVDPHEVPVLPGGDLTPALGANAAGPPCDAMWGRLVWFPPQSMWGRLVWFPAWFLVQTGSLVMSSDQS